MELELGLALSSTPKLKELDLISHVNQVNDDDNSSLWSQSSGNDNDNDNDEDEWLWYVNNNHGMKKRSLKGERSFVYLGTKTLPLLLWDTQPNEHNKPKEPNILCTSSSFAFNKSEEEGIVGWPPIKSERKKKWQQNEQLVLGGRRCFQVGENGGRRGGFRSKYVVKVQMQGFFITRKIDLMLHHSFHSLTPTLLSLFGKGQDSVENYKLAYQDKDGDWFLVGDIPWRTFVGSVRRLKLLRRED